MAAAQFVRDLIAAVPFRLHTVLTDNGVQFANRSRDIHAFEHIFGRVCREHDIEHRLTRPNDPWTNGQVERMNRTIKDGEADQETIRGIVFPLNVKRFHYDSHDQLRTPPRLHGSLQLCTQAQDAERPHALRIHLQDLDFGARQIHRQSDPPDAGTEHLTPAQRHAKQHLHRQARPHRRVVVFRLSAELAFSAAFRFMPGFNQFVSETRPLSTSL
jgi:RNA-directed DNA polymerase